MLKFSKYLAKLTLIKKSKKLLTLDTNKNIFYFTELEEQRGSYDVTVGGG